MYFRATLTDRELARILIILTIRSCKTFHHAFFPFRKSSVQNYSRNAKKERERETRLFSTQNNNNNNNNNDA